MLKINENEVLLSKSDLDVLIGAAMALTLDSYDMSDKLETLIMECAAETCCAIENHIWGKKKIPKETMDTAKRMTRIEEDPDETPKESYEDNRSICRLLLAALQRTRAYHDITDLLYDPYSGTLAKFSGGGYRIINTEGDSGIAMINDILAHI